MKQSDQLVGALSRLCQQSAVEVSQETLVSLVKYLEAVLAANRTTNLTRITDPATAMRLHLLDSLCALPEVEASAPGVICDIGTGAGFPGVPIALAAQRECTLLDSVGKKAGIVAMVLQELKLDRSIVVSRDRAEQHARNHDAGYAVVTARAVAPLPSLVELAAPLLFHGGRLVALKGSPSADEMKSGLSAAAVVGLEFRSRRDFTLPGGDEQRCVIVYERVRKSRVHLPRREGLAQHTPLG